MTVLHPAAARRIGDADQDVLLAGIAVQHDLEAANSVMKRVAPCSARDLPALLVLSSTSKAPSRRDSSAPPGAGGR